jgi:hypothetical protein
MWHQPAEEEPSGVVGSGAAAAGLHEFQFFGHDEDHDSVTWLFNDPAPHLHRGPASAAAAVANGVAAESEQRRAPPPLFDNGYAHAHAHAQYGQLPGHGLTFDVPLSRGGDVASAAVLEAGLGLGGGGGGSNPATTSSATIVSGSVPHLSPESCMVPRRQLQFQADMIYECDSCLYVHAEPALICPFQACSTARPFPFRIHASWCNLSRLLLVKPLGSLCQLIA